MALVVSECHRGHLIVSLLGNFNPDLISLYRLQHTLELTFTARISQVAAWCNHGNEYQLLKNFDHSKQDFFEQAGFIGGGGGVLGGEIQHGFHSTSSDCLQFRICVVTSYPKGSRGTFLTFSRSDRFSLSLAAMI